MRRSVLATLIALLAITGGAAFYYFRLRGPQTSTTTVTNEGQGRTGPRVAAVRETPLPDSLERPGLVSRRFDPMRLYVSVAPEIAINKPGGGANASQVSAANMRVEADSSKVETLDSVPILIVLENDSYLEVDARRDLRLGGEELFNLFITHPTLGIVFRHSEPAAETVWGPAERKTFNVRWRGPSSLPGECVISVQLAFAGSAEVQIRTRLK